MLARERYCAVCGCLFSLPDIRDPVHPDPDENPLLPYGDPYDSRLLPLEMTKWLTGFRIVGRWADIDSSLVNLPSATDFFLCPPAIWEYGDVSGDPQTLTLADNTVRIGVYEIIDDANCMLFPIHKACLDLLQRLCQIRQPQSSITSSQQPKTLVAFCDALQQRRWMNLFKPDKPSCQDCYYARSGGIEWPHGYYGARQFWADEWNTEPGWEHLCADPSPNRIPNLHSYLLSELPKSSSTLSVPTLSTNQISDRLGWLFPEEAEAMIANETAHGDWEEGIQALLQKANMISADEGGEDEGNQKHASVPLGLKNRWRIWKILQGI